MRNSYFANREACDVGYMYATASLNKSLDKHSAAISYYHLCTTCPDKDNEIRVQHVFTLELLLLFIRGHSLSM